MRGGACSSVRAFTRAARKARSPRPPLQALRAVAEVCCDRNCDGVWAGLEAFGGDPVAVCAGDGVVCDTSGHVIELEIDQTEWSCDVAALAPLGTLPRLQKLHLVGMPGLTGASRALCWLIDSLTHSQRHTVWCAGPHSCAKGLWLFVVASLSRPLASQPARCVAACRDR